MRLGHILGWNFGGWRTTFPDTRLIMSVTALYPAQKQFFLRRTKRRFGQAISQSFRVLTEWGFWAKETFWASFDPNRSR